MTINPFVPAHQKIARGLLAVALLLAAVSRCQAAIPPLERILPADTLLVVAVPDMDKMREVKKTSPQSRFWSDPAMKPFTDHVINSWNAEFVAPLERELGIHFDDFTSLPHGLVAFALTRSGGPDKTKSPGMAFILDTKDKSSQLRTNLTIVRKKWLDSGKTMKTEKLHGIEFMELTVSADDMPKTLKKFFSDSNTATTPDDATKKTESKGTVVVGQFESLLILGNTAQAVDNIATRLAGGSAPTLADVDNYMANQASTLRGAPLFAWANVHAFLELALEKPPGASDDSGAMGPMGMFKPEKIIAATGINGLRSVALSYHDTGDGILTQFFLRSPESSRQGILKLVSGEGHDSSPPPFVPADVIKFQRWRLDGQKSWAALEKMMTDMSPTGLNLLNYFIDSANTAAREKDPDFDLRKQLIGNLGNDFISYQKVPKGPTIGAPPTLFLIGSPNPEQLVGAFLALTRLMGPSGNTDREFLGHKIYSAVLPSNPMGGMPSSPGPITQTFNFTAGAGYVAMSSDATMLEEYLRSAQNPLKALRDTPGLSDAAQKVSGMGTGWFGYENQNQNMRVMFEALRKSAASGNNNASAPFLAAFSGIPGLGNNLKNWLDFSLLPPFDKVSKYFYYSVFASSTSVDGLTFKVFAPVPPGL